MQDLFVKDKINYQILYKWIFSLVEKFAFYESLTFRERNSSRKYDLVKSHILEYNKETIFELFLEKETAEILFLYFISIL